MSDDDVTEVHTGARAAAAAETIAIPGYRLERRLGEGGMGAVYLAEEIALGRMVAIKVVSDRIARDAEVRARFLREARLLATVEHPNVVRVYTFGAVEDRPYLVMEYIEGETLAQRIQRTGAMATDDALQVLRAIVDALTVAWEKQVIHRDIKPSNILFDRRGQLKVADFGLAKGIASTSTESSLTQTGYLLGSPHYIAPEQAQGHDSDFRADIYSLGIVLFEMVTGRKPFEAASALAVVAKHLHEELPSARGLKKDVPAHIEDLIHWMTEKDPKRRPPSYGALLAALPTAAATQEMTPPRVRRRRGVSWTAAWTAALLAFTAAILGGWLAWARFSGAKTAAADKAGDRIVIAVAPFYGPDPDSAREGRVMASLVAREIDRRMRDQVKVLGVEETGSALRDTDAARALGERLGATLVIWGDAYKFRGEAEIEPSLTTVPRKTAKTAETQRAAVDPFVDLMRSAVRVSTDAPNQIELRKTSAEGIGELVILAVATQLLHEQNDAEGALALLSELKPTADAHQQKAICLLQLGRESAAVNELQQALAVDPKHAATRATLAELALRDGRYREAAAQLAAIGSARFTAKDGILYDGKLYAVEQFRNNERSFRAPTLLAIDPAAERVVARYWLPGTPAAFRVDGDDLVIRYDGGMDGAPRIETVRFTHGRFDPPRQLPANPFVRMNGVRAQWIPVREFIGDVATPRAMMVKHPVFRYVRSDEAPPGGPKTFAELKASLEKAIERDPTQPAYRLWLAMAEWSLGERAAAEQNARLAFLDDTPEIPYYQYAWLARQLDAFGRRDWADLAYAQALRRRKMHAAPISFSLLLERLINAPMTRGAASRSRWEPDPSRQFAMYERSRELSGPTPENDRAVAPVWIRYFESKGDAASAARARRLLQDAKGPEPGTRAAAIDALSAAIFCVAFMIVVVLLWGIVRARRGASWRVTVVALLVCELLLLLAHVALLRRAAAITELPIGLADALGSAPIIETLEKQLPAKPELAFAAAVANHLGGRTKRANELYAQTVSEQSTDNANDLRNNRPPRHVPPSADVAAMLVRVPWPQTFADAVSAWTTQRATFADDPWQHRILQDSALLGITAVFLLLFAAWISIAPAADARAPGTMLRVAFGTLAVVFVLAMFVASHKAEKETEGVPTPGPIAAELQPIYGNASPIPPMPSYDAALRWTALHAPPMRVFFTAVIAASALAIALLAPLIVHFLAGRVRRA